MKNITNNRLLAFNNPALGETLGNSPEAAAEGTTFVNYFVDVWNAFITIGAIMVLINFLWGALEWITAGGDSSKVEKGRDRITQSMIGLLILVSSFVIIGFVSNLFFGDEFDILNLHFNEPGAAQNDDTFKNGIPQHFKEGAMNFFAPPVAYAIDLDIGGAAKTADVPGTSDYEPGDGEAGFGKLIDRILTIVMTIGALMLFINLIWGGIAWITAGGDTGKTESARNRISQSIIGLIVLASAVALFVLIQDFLKLEVLVFN